MGPQHTEYYVGWGTLALINAGLAQAKNRRGWLWFLVSLLIGPVATFLIVVLDKADPWPKDGDALHFKVEPKDRSGC